jgi:uncharacterized protein (UPF0261 family)
LTSEKCILLISTLDTKGIETFYFRDKIKELGKIPLVMDLSMRGQGESPAEISATEVAVAGGSSLKQIHESGDRAANTEVMVSGAIKLARGLVAAGKVHGVAGIGGSTGSLMATDVMRALPFGLPKLMVSSTAALPGMATRYIGTGDIALMHSVVEVAGVSEVLKNVIDRAAYAICGMVEATPLEKLKSRAKLIAITMLGPCEKCASRVRKSLEEKELQVVGFSAAGIGDRAMEEMIAQGLFDGVVDLAPSGIIEHLIGGMRDAGPHRLESAGKIGIPQVISTCSMNHITPAKSKYTEDYRKRRRYNLDRLRTWLRASPEELIQAARVFARKLNQAKGPVKVVIPLKGWSSADYPGNETYDPKEDLIFVNELERLLKPEIEVCLIEANMEDPQFAQAITKACDEVF